LKDQRNGINGNEPPEVTIKQQQLIINELNQKVQTLQVYC